MDTVINTVMYPNIPLDIMAQSIRNTIGIHHQFLTYRLKRSTSHEY